MPCWALCMLKKNNGPQQVLCRMTQRVVSHCHWSAWAAPDNHCLRSSPCLLCIPGSRHAHKTGRREAVTRNAWSGWAALLRGLQCHPENCRTAVYQQLQACRLGCKAPDELMPARLECAGCSFIMGTTCTKCSIVSLMAAGAQLQARTLGCKAPEELSASCPKWEGLQCQRP